jgi:uncharacterized protein (TIGR00369 family)
MVIETIENLREIYEGSPFNKFVGIKLEEFEEGYVVYSLKIGPHHKNVNQSVHGGVFFSILDSVMGATVRSITKQPITTINSSINFFAPLCDGDQIFASAKVVQCGKTIATAEAEVKNCKGAVLAKSIGTFKIIRNQK